MRMSEAPQKQRRADRLTQGGGGARREDFTHLEPPESNALPGPNRSVREEARHACPRTFRPASPQGGGADEFSRVHDPPLELQLDRRERRGELALAQRAHGEVPVLEGA